MKSTLPSAPPESPAPRAASQPTVPHDEGVKVLCSCTIRCPAGELYAFWRRLENLRLIVKHPIDIVPLSETRSHWSVTAPGGDGHAEWDALIINDHPGELIAWRSDEGADIPNAGTVRFEPAPNGEGTEVTVSLQYDPPGGKLVAWLAKLTGKEPTQQVREALRRFKEIMESGNGPASGSAARAGVLP